MNHILVLTAKPNSKAITRDLADRITENTAANLSHAPVPRWLAEGDAFELALGACGGDAGAGRLRAEILRVIGDLPIDVNVIGDPGEGRRKKLLVADMESTIIAQECLDELAEHVGLRDKISDITARAMRGELDFEAALRERVGLLAGLEVARLEELAGRLTLTPGAETLVATMQSHGAYCALVSGGFTFFTARIARALAFDRHQANVLELDEDEERLTGGVQSPVLGREAKLAALLSLMKEFSLGSEQSMAVGDGANDLAMIKAAGLGVAFRAKPLVAAEAAAEIRHCDLTGLLYLQGYTRAEFKHKR